MKWTIKHRSKIIIKALEPFLTKDKKIIDVGCGEGTVSTELINHFKFDLTGTDILDYGQKPFPYKTMRNNLKIDYKTNEFDIGLFIDVLHHVPADKQISLIKEALRVAKEVLIFEVSPTFIAKFGDILCNLIHNPKMKVPLTHRTKEVWGKLFAENNISYRFYPVITEVVSPLTNYLFHLKPKK